MSIVELLCVVGLMVPAISKRLAILAPIAAAYVVAEMLLFSGTGPVAVDGADVDDASTQCVIRSNAILTAPHGSLLRGGSTARNRFPSGSQKQNCAGCGSAIATIVDKSRGAKLPSAPRSDRPWHPRHATLRAWQVPPPSNRMPIAYPHREETSRCRRADVLRRKLANINVEDAIDQAAQTPCAVGGRYALGGRMLGPAAMRTLGA